MKSHLSGCIFTRHADKSLVHVSIETKLARNDSYMYVCKFVFCMSASLFFEAPGATVFQQ